MRKHLVVTLLAPLSALGFALPSPASATPAHQAADPSVLATPSARSSVAPSPTVAQRDSIERLYLAYFLRDGEPAGVAHWSAVYASGRSLVAISNVFAQSSEFKNRYGQLDNGDFVVLAYANVFDREPDAAGLAYWTKQLDSMRRSRGAFMVGLSESAEFKRITSTL